MLFTCLDFGIVRQLLCDRQLLCELENGTFECRRIGDARPGPADRRELRLRGRLLSRHQREGDGQDASRVLPTHAEKRQTRARLRRLVSFEHEVYFDTGARKGVF